MSKEGVTTRSKVLVMRETRSAYLFLLPALIFFVGFVIIPMVLCLVTSFFNYTMGDFSFAGIKNYVQMFQDPIFIVALKNTILLVVVTVPAVTLFSFISKTSLFGFLAYIIPQILENELHDAWGFISS